MFADCAFFLRRLPVQRQRKPKPLLQMLPKRREDSNVRLRVMATPRETEQLRKVCLLYMRSGGMTMMQTGL